MDKTNAFYDRIDEELALLEAESRARAAERAASARRWGFMAAAVPVAGASASLVSVAALLFGSISHFIAGGGAVLAGLAAVVAATVPSAEHQRDATEHAHQLLRLSTDIHYSRTFEADRPADERLEMLRRAANRWMAIDAELPVMPATKFMAGPLSALDSYPDPPVDDANDATAAHDATGDSRD